MKKIFTITLIAFLIQFLSAQTTVIYNSTIGGANVRPTACTTGTAMDQVPYPGKLVSTSFTSASCSYDWYFADIPGNTGARQGYIVSGAGYLLADASASYITAYGIGAGQGLFVRPYAGAAGTNTIKFTTGALINLDVKIYDGQKFALVSVTPSFSNGYNWYEIYITSYCAQTTGWVRSDFVTVTNPTPQYGSITATITPQGAINANAQWSIDAGTNWLNSGVSATNLSVGSYTVTYKSISGWTKPADQAITVTANTNSSTTGNYTANPQYGSITATITPQGAINANAKWSIDGGANWINSGTPATNLTVGSYIVTYSSISGWTKPVDQTVSVTANGNTTTTGNYTANPQYGSITATITPQGAINANAKWSIDGGANWINSGTPATNLTVGSYTVTYSTISGWTKPADQPITVTANTNSPTTGNYIPNTTNLPDLIVQNTSYSVYNVVAGSSTIVSYSIKNMGIGNAGQSYVSFHLSSDNIFQAGVDPFLVDTLVPSIATTGSTPLMYEQVNIPANTASGTWYVLLSADGNNNQINETDESNNTSYVQINVLAAYPIYDDYHNISGYDGTDNADCVNDQNDNGGPADIWGFYKYQCVSYVAFKVNQSWGYNFPSYKFCNSMTGSIAPTSSCSINQLGTKLSNACHWDERLGQNNGLTFHYTVDNNPAVGAIAQWNGGCCGHVAFVNEVNLPNITVTEYNYHSVPGPNYNPCTFSSRTIAATNVTNFIHTEVGGLGGGEATSIFELLSETEKEITVFPNPSNGEISVSFKDFIHEGNSEVNVFNSIGGLVFSKNINSLETNFELNLEFLNNGLYLFQVTTGKVNSVQRIIINH